MQIFFIRSIPSGFLQLFGMLPARGRLPYEGKPTFAWLKRRIQTLFFQRPRIDGVKIMDDGIDVGTALFSVGGSLVRKE